MQHIFHASSSRGHAMHGWLNSFHTFSFANYFDKTRMNFGALRVLNDDTVSAGMGFSTHPHSNMEIISIPLWGDLQHQDSMGNTTIIKQGDVQIMSAGTGVDHSEKNYSISEEVHFLQIWIMPSKQNTKPSYDQKKIENKNNGWNNIVSPIANDNAVSIQQEAWLSIGNFDKNKLDNYTLHNKNNGVYFFVLHGSVLIENLELNNRDGLGIFEKEILQISVNENCSILAIEVPMQF